MTRDELLELAKVAGASVLNYPATKKSTLVLTGDDKIETFGRSAANTQIARILQIVERIDTPERRAIANSIRRMK